MLSTEVDQMRKLTVAAMRLHQIETQLLHAKNLGTVARRTLPDGALPSLTHLDRWLRLPCARTATRAHWLTNPRCSCADRRPPGALALMQ